MISYIMLLYACPRAEDTWPARVRVRACVVCACGCACVRARVRWHLNDWARAMRTGRMILHTHARTHACTALHGGGDAAFDPRLARRKVLALERVALPGGHDTL